MNIRGFMESLKTGDIFAIQMSREGKVIAAFGPIRLEETVPWEMDRPYSYSASIGKLIQGNREEFQILYLDTRLEEMEGKWQTAKPAARRSAGSGWNPGR